jgi:hypothetical protein
MAIVDYLCCKGMVMQFGNMIKKTSRIPPLSFNGYGNYCGMFGSGREMDNIDRLIYILTAAN